MRVVTEDVAVVTGAGLGLVGITDHVLLAGLVPRWQHEAPLNTGRESRAAAAAKPRGLEIIDDLLRRRFVLKDLLPGAVTADLAVAVERPAALQRERFEDDAVLNSGHRLTRAWRAPDRP